MEYVQLLFLTRDSQFVKIRTCNNPELTAVRDSWQLLCRLWRFSEIQVISSIHVLSVTHSV